MYIAEIALMAVLLFVTLEQAVAVAIFLAYCRRTPRALEERELPETIVVLALRGCDAQLEDCLEAIFQQDYPRYRVRVVVDNRDDPAWDLAERTVERLGARHVELQVLESPASTCSLKCSALSQATSNIEESVQVVAFVDADVTPTRTWLRELVAPLANPRVGAAMGNRWYAPREGHVGSLLRYTWNVAVVVNMFYWKVPWGGTLAVRADVLRHSNLRDLWSRAGCDDVPLRGVLLRKRLRLVFVPNLLLANQSDCDIPHYLRFTARQLLWVRLYQPGCWWTGAVFQVLVVAAQVLVGLLALAAATSGRWMAVVWLASVLCTNLFVTFGLLVFLERYAARVLKRRGIVTRVNWFKAAASIPLSEFFSLVGLHDALFRRVVQWRGIDYRVEGPWKIRMLEYRPMTGNGQSASRAGSQSADEAG